TAMSPIIYEVLDVGTGITDGEGNLVGSGAGIPTFIGVLDKAVRRIREIYGSKGIREGDLFVTNDPYFGGVTHLSDIVIAQPVFFGGDCIAWTASIAHWSDVGGITPGSMSTRATEIFQEGLRLPAVHLFESGQKVESVFEIIAANSRMPEFSMGDLWAQIAACRLAGQRVSRLASNYGLDAYNRAVQGLFDEGERRSLSGLARLPSGTYEISQEQDDGERWNAKITTSSAKFIVDIRDNPRQKAKPYNTSRDGSVIAAQMLFKALAAPDLFPNEGSFRPLVVLTEPGTIFDATGTTPHGYYFETRIRLYDMLWNCMATAFPEALPAGHFGSVCGTVISGMHPDTGRRFTLVEPQMGGWGATSKRDGLNCMYTSNHGDTFNCPIEICEARYGIDVGWKRMNSDDAGDGLHRGGKGLSISYRPRSQATLAAGFSRSQVRVWGSNGGDEGGTNQLRVVRKDGTLEKHAFVSELVLEPGDELVIETANGGGWGRKLANSSSKIISKGEDIKATDSN
ncbi:MAG: hydantoinase B/oxoprolinase family protein, partial [Albidovulum sp.]|nr:hydantoinase B/oxoprolinase family protein [Albidovulum sp.]